MKRVRDNATNIHRNALVVGSQAVEEILERLAMVYNGGAQELDGDDSSLAVLGALNGVDDRKLVEVGANGDLVATRNKEEVRDGEIANVGIVDEVGEGSVALEWRVSRKYGYYTREYSSGALIVQHTISRVK